MGRDAGKIHLALLQQLRKTCVYKTNLQALRGLQVISGATKVGIEEALRGFLRWSWFCIVRPYGAGGIFNLLVFVQNFQ